MTHKNLNSYDHYVSETYLKHFCFKEKFTYVYRKKEYFVKDIPINSICGEYGGDICEEFENKFGLREILSIVEPAWNFFIEAIKNRNLIEVHEELSKEEEMSFLEKVLLYMSYLRCLSPTMRKLLKEQIEALYNEVILPSWADSNTQLDNSTRKSIKDRNIEIKIGNESYYKAKVVTRLVDIAKNLYDRKWIILKNSTDINFITSDTPLISLLSRDLFLPLTPEYALVINQLQSNEIQYHNVSPTEVKNYNKNIVQLASDLVISSKEDSGIKRLVNKYRAYKGTPDTISLPDGRVIFQLKAKKTT